MTTIWKTSARAETSAVACRLHFALCSIRVMAGYLSLGLSGSMWTGSDCAGPACAESFAVTPRCAGQAGDEPGKGEEREDAAGHPSGLPAGEPSPRTKGHRRMQQEQRRVEDRGI